MVNKRPKIQLIAEKLQAVVSKDYEWPTTPAEGYEPEFIAHPDGTLILDFLNMDKAMFWSEFANEVFETPFTEGRQPITWQHLKKAGIEFMS